jgi:hypothetical protein
LGGFLGKFGKSIFKISPRDFSGEWSQWSQRWPGNPAGEKDIIMVVIRSAGKFLTPFVVCDACHEQIKGAGVAWILTPADDQARVGEAYFSHAHCKGIFDAQNPSPPGWRWARADIHEVLTLLSDNTKVDPEKVPVVKVPRVH